MEGSGSGPLAPNLPPNPLGYKAPLADDLVQAAEQMKEEAMQIDPLSGGGSLLASEPQSLQPAETAAEQPTVFVSLTEKRETAGNARPPRSRSSGSGHYYVLKFFLVDSHSNLHLAAVGQDLGDSHYEYTNETGFPALHCHNKSEVKAWADQIIASSQERAGYKIDVVTDVVPTDGSTVKLPNFVSYSETREELPDGRHLLKWYLLDTEGHMHLAVTGEEKETRDGHYSYHTESVFDYAAPLEAGNQDAVKRWLDSMIEIPHEITLPAAGHATGKAPHAARAHAQARQHNPFHGGYNALYATPGSPATRGRRGRGRGRGPGRPPRSGIIGTGTGGRITGRFGGGGDSLLRQATGNMGRRGRGAWRTFDPDRDARDLVAAELRRWAQEEAVRREAGKKAALSYAMEGLSEDETSVVERCVNVLRGAVAGGPSYLPAAGQTGSVPQRRNLVATLGALREVSHLRPSLALSAYPGIRAAITQLSKSGQADVSGLAFATLQQWLRAAVAQVQVLADPRYTQDPRPVLDELVADQARFDPVVTAITHKKLSHPETERQAHSQMATPGVASLAFPSPALRPAELGLGGAPLLGGAVSDSLGGGGVGGGAPSAPSAGAAMDSQPSGGLVEGPAVVDDGGAEILPPFEQQLAEEGVDF